MNKQHHKTTSPHGGHTVHPGSVHEPQGHVAPVHTAPMHQRIADPDPSEVPYPSAYQVPNDGPSLPSVNFGSLAGPSKVYIVDFIMMHIALIVVIISGIMLVDVIINSFETAESNIYYSLYTGNTTLGTIAAALVSVPLFLITFIRTRKSEQADPTLVQSRRRRTLLYFFLAGLGITILSYSISIMYSLLVWIFSEPSKYEEPTWKSLIKQLGALAIVVLVQFLVRRRLWPAGAKR